MPDVKYQWKARYIHVQVLNVHVTHEHGYEYAQGHAYKLSAQPDHIYLGCMYSNHGYNSTDIYYTILVYNIM